MSSSSKIRKTQFSWQCGRITLQSSLLAGSLILSSTLPVFAGPDFGGMRFGGIGEISQKFGGQQNLGQQNFLQNLVRDNKPNIPVQIPVQMPVQIPVQMPVQIPVQMSIFNNDAITRSASKLNFSIDAIATKVMSRIETPRMPTIPDVSAIMTQNFSQKQITITPVSFSPPMTPVVVTPLIDNSGSNSNQRMVSPAMNASPMTLTIDSRGDSDNASRSRDGGRGANFQVAAIQPQAVNQTGSAGVDATSQNPAVNGSAEAAEIQAQVFVGRGLGAVVTSNFVTDPVDAEGIKKALSEHVALFEGTTLFVPDHDMVVETRHGQVNLASKSVVLVTSSENQLAVYDIHDHKRGAISVTTGGKTYTLAPGRHVVISTDQSGDFAMANAFELIPHTDVSCVESGETKTVFTSEFSIPAAINSVGALKSMAASDNPELQKISHKVMKTAAILLYMRSANYKHYLRPRVTLLSQY